jgi:hypothetical protein
MSRILSRLRSRHAKRSQKTAGKPAVISQLGQVLRDGSITTWSGFPRQSLNDMRDQAKALEDLFIRLEGIPDHSTRVNEIREVLEEIVQKAHEFTAVTDLNRTLRYFSGDPSLKEHLPNAIGKLGRYYSVSSELVCAARDRTCSIFHSIQVEPYKIDVPASIGSVGYKVHAEIQLLFFYEAHPTRLRPRIICSSKSACYLCNLFFRLHRGFHMPRTLERHHDLATTTTNLKAAIDGQFRIASRAKKRPCYHPNESVLLPSAYWPSSSALSSATLSPTIPPPTLPRSLVQEVPSCQPSPSSKPKLTDSTVPPELSHSVGIDTETATTPRLLNPGVNWVVEKPTIDTVSAISIGYNRIPYSQRINATTPSLLLQLDELCLTVDFVEGVSGHLLVTLAGDAADGSNPCYITEIESIPTNTELKLDCPHGSNELIVRFQKAQKGIICVLFVWERLVTGIP